MASKSSPGFSRLLVALYGILALAASARGLYELFTKFSQAPVSYALSLVSALVYVVATIALIRVANPTWYRIARITILFELIGVLSVGFLSIAAPNLFAHPSVWSFFGIGYGLLPLALPVVGLIWLSKHKAA